MRVKVTVTRDHIRRGQHGKPDMCPIAIAVKEQLPGTEPIVGPVDVILFGEGNGAEFDLPKKARRFVTMFDLRLPWPFVRPFSFEFDYEKEEE